MKHLTFMGLLGIAAMLAAGAACGGDDEGSGGNNGGSTSDGGSGAAGGGTGASGGGTAGMGPVCEAPEPAHAGETLDINTINAVVMGTDGSPAAGIITKVCGTDICSDILQAGVDGSTTVQAMGTFQDARFVYGSGKGYGEWAVFMTNADANRDYGQVHAVTLPDINGGMDMTAGATVTSQGVTLTIPDGASLDFDTLTYMDTELGFRANAVDPTMFNFPAVDASGLNIEAVVALAPIDTVVCPAAALTVPNIPGWTAGAEVELYVHGHLTFEHYAPYGGWSKISEAVVDGDGATITTKDGEGIELLATYGLVLKQ